MSSRNNFLLPFTAGVIVGGFVVRFVYTNNHNIDDGGKEIDNDDTIVVSCEYRENKPLYNPSSLSISFLYSSFSLPNFFTSPDSSSSLTSVYAKLKQRHVYQKNLFEKEQTLHTDTISFNYQYNSLLTETNIFKGYSYLQISKSKEKLDLLRRKIKSSIYTSSGNTSNYRYISEIVKMRMAEMKWMENFSKVYEERLERFMMDLDKMKKEFDEYKRRTIKEIEDLKLKIEDSNMRLECIKLKEQSNKQ